MRYYYAKLTEDGIVKGISNLSGEVDQPNMIAIDEETYNSDILGKLYQDGQFIEQEG